MEPIHFKEANLIMTSPKGMEGMGDLPVMRAQDTLGYPVIISCWKPSKEDLENLNKDGVIYLTVLGHTTTPVQLSTKSPIIPAEPTFNEGIKPKQ